MVRWNRLESGLGFLRERMMMTEGRDVLCLRWREEGKREDLDGCGRWQHEERRFGVQGCSGLRWGQWLTQ